LERAPESVLDDFQNGVISRDAVQEIYGVVLSQQDQQMDWAATERLRAALREARRG
jgi:N-methylhydantoinase B/oxoprolinase/acetone carboxylase alpha subunit